MVISLLFLKKKKNNGVVNTPPSPEGEDGGNYLKRQKLNNFLAADLSLQRESSTAI